MTVLRFFHRWLGLLLSFIVVAIALSGGILIFHDAALRFSLPELSNPITSEQDHAYSTVLTELEHRLPDASIRQIRFPMQGKNAFQVWLSDGSEAFVHPISGEVITRWTWDESLMDILFEFHVHLFAGEVGEQMNGIVGILVLGFVISGLVLWWPRRKKWRIRSLIPQHSTSLHFMRSHSALGVIFSAAILLIVATGITMVFNRPIVTAITSLLDSQPPTIPSATVIYVDRPIQSWTTILKTVSKVLPDGQLISVRLPSKDNAAMSFRKRMPEEWHPNGRSFVLLNPYTGDVLQAINAQQQEFGMRITQKFYPLHASKIGGIPYTLLALSTSGALVLLGIFGIMSFVSRTWPQRKKQKSTQNPIHILDHDW
ncbi:PepSY-associated TM helix domain-containing protein [Candidatus Nitrospira salsa]